MQTKLWGGPLDGCELNVDDPPRPEMVIPQFPGWSQTAGEVLESEMIRHHYVYDQTAQRYNYAGDWPR